MDKVSGYIPMITRQSTRNRIKKNLSSAAGKGLGVCELLRFIYDEVYKIEDEQIKHNLEEMLIDAMGMVKKMSDRLVYYKATYQDTTGHSGSNIPKLNDVYKRKQKRIERCSL